MRVEDLVPSIDEEEGDAERRTHDWREPKERRGRVVHAHVPVVKQELRQAPPETAERACGGNEEEATEHEVRLRGYHEEDSGADEEDHADEKPGEPFEPQ